MGVHNLDRALRPGGLAVASIGAGRLARPVLRNLLRHEYTGDVFFVGEKAPPGVRVPSVNHMRQLPPGVDLVVADAPAAHIERLIQSCAEMGIPGVLVLSPDVPPGVLQALKQEHPNTRVIGPGSQGLLIPALALNASLTQGMPRHGGLALVSSSPTLWKGLISRAAHTRLGISHLISLGGQADVDLADLTDYLHRRGRVSALLLDVEELPPPSKLLPAVWAFARDRPVAACKCDSEWDWTVFSSALKRAGGIPLRERTELLNLAELLPLVDYPPPGDRIAVLAGEEAEGNLQGCAGKTAPLTPETRAALEECGCSVKGNRIHLHPGRDADPVLPAVEALLPDSGVHMLLVSIPDGMDAQAVSALATAAKKAGKPLVAVTTAQQTQQTLREAGIPVYSRLSNATHALICLADCVRTLEELYKPWGSLFSGPAPGEMPHLPCGEISGKELEEVLALWGISVSSARARLAAPYFSLGLRRHPVFGAVLTASSSLAAGAPPAVGLPPLTAPLAQSMLAALPHTPTPSAAPALVELLLRLSRLAVDLPEVVELELEPIMVGERHAIPLKARGRIEQPSPTPHLSLCPYPEGRVQTIRLKDGSYATLRPIRPDDEPSWKTMLTRSSLDSLRLRYHSVHHEPSTRMARRHCCIDYRRELVLVVEVDEEGSRALAGEGELFLDPDCDLAEFAVFVADPWQGSGLGSLLTDHMVGMAAELRAKRITCELTPDNVRMISLLQRRGFAVRIMMEDRVVFAEKSLR